MNTKVSLLKFLRKLVGLSAVGAAGGLTTGYLLGPEGRKKVTDFIMGEDSSVPLPENAPAPKSEPLPTNAPAPKSEPLPTNAPKKSIQDRIVEFYHKFDAPEREYTDAVGDTWRVLPTWKENSLVHGGIGAALGALSGVNSDRLGMISSVIGGGAGGFGGGKLGALIADKLNLKDGRASGTLRATAPILTSLIGAALARKAVDMFRPDKDEEK